MSGINHGTLGVTGTGSARIDGVLSGVKWQDTTLTYSFPTTNEYTNPYFQPGPNETDGWIPFNAAMKAVVNFALNTSAGPTQNDGFSVEGFTNLTIFNVAEDDAHMRFSQTTEDPLGISTAWTYRLSGKEEAGDSWFSNVWLDYTAPKMGDYAFAAFMHEAGHGLGLKHTHEGDGLGVVPTAYDSLEYTVMSYRSYPGASNTAYYNETYGYPQTWMMQDIAALQHMYGANFTVNSGNTVYRWSPGSGETLVNGVAALSPAANRIFATIWDGGGTDTYDLSAYASDLDVDLAPGGHSVFSKAQLADLGHDNDASGNIYNALQYQDDPRSLIENILAGKGNDKLWGNQAANKIKGGDGRDLVAGHGGKDELDGQNGNDTMFGGWGSDKLWGRNGNDRLYGGGNNDILSGADGVDQVFGGAGHDNMFGGNQNDRLIGGGGDDFGRGDSGKDYLSGGWGNDRLEGNDGDDNLMGGHGNDTLRGGNGADVLLGEVGNDFLYGFTGNDKLSGNAGDDFINAGSGADTLIGGGGKDILEGGAGNDLLAGNDGNDRLNGQNGNDILIGGAGFDILTGGHGADVFRFEDISDSPAGAAADRIMDFKVGVDRIDLTGVGENSAPELKLIGNVGSTDGPTVRAVKVGNDTSVRVDYDGDGAHDFTVKVVGVTNLQASDFIL